MAIRCSIRRCWLELCWQVENDPWELPYPIVTRKIVARPTIPGTADPTRVQEIVQVLFPMDESRKQRVAKEGADMQREKFSKGEQQKACKGLKAGKASGLDGIQNKQKLILLRKGNKPLNEPFSYRPICLIDTMGKLKREAVRFPQR